MLVWNRYATLTVSARLTYKSTIHILKAKLAAGAVVEFVPTLRKGQTIRRGMYLTRAVDAWVSQRRTGRKAIDYQMFINEALALFSRGGKINNKFYMKRLHASEEEVWEIRIVEDPQSRIFGAFLGKDCFVCTNMRMRHELGRYNSPEWKFSIQKARQIWSTLFPGVRPWTGTHFSHYVTNGVHYDWPKR